MMISPVVITTSRKENNMAPVIISTSRKEHNIAPEGVLNSGKVSPSFTGKGSGLLSGVKNAYKKGWDNFIEDGIIKYGLKPVMNSKPMGKFADWAVNIDNMPSHMATLGSVVTTYFYASRTKKTLNKDEEQKKRANTLMLNQWMVTGVSTALGYGVNGALGKFSKRLGYKFREVNQGNPKLAARIKGFDIAKQLLIFTMMYRYVAPVFVTPVASKLSKWWELRKADKARIAEIKQKEQQAQQPQQGTAKVVGMNPQPQQTQKTGTAKIVGMNQQTQQTQQAQMNKIA